jgi:DNA-binding protein HU-beta
MNKQELIEKIMTKTKGELTHKDAERVVNGVFDEIKAAVAAGDTVQLVGFGTFSSKDRAAREARNPQTGETLQSAAKKVPAFKAGKAFKDAVNA